MGTVADAARDTINRIGLPTGYRTVFGGDVQNLEETKGYVLEAILLAVVFIYLILASLFGSFVQPLSIMLALPLSFLGVSLSLLITGGTLNVMSMIGIIMLMGLVTKNAILLVDYTNQLREEGMALEDAIRRAGEVRFLPIVLTSMTAIGGLLPLALQGQALYAPLAWVIIGGLIVTETVFNIPGIARFLVEALRWRDYPIVQNLVMLIAVVVVVANFTVDMLYAAIDPRIRYGD